MKLRRLLLAGAAVATVGGTALFNLSTADAAQSSCSGTRVGSQSMQGVGTLELFQVSNSSSSTTYCIKVTRTSSAVTTSSISSSQIATDGHLINLKALVSRTTRNPIAANQAVAHCSSCRPYWLQGNAQFPQEGRNSAGGHWKLS